LCAQLLVDSILHYKEPAPPKGDSDVNSHNNSSRSRRRHPDFPDSRLDESAIDRVLGLRVADLKRELAGLHNLPVSEVAKMFGPRKNVLQNRLLRDLESRLSKEGGDGDGSNQNNSNDRVDVETPRDPANLQSAAAASDPTPMETVEPLHDDEHVDTEDRGSVMEVVVEETEEAPAAATTAMAEEDVSPRSGRAGDENHLQSPPKVSEMADDRCSSRSSSSAGEKEHDQDPVVPTDSASLAQSAAPSGSRHAGLHLIAAVDTTVASIPFDECATAAEIDVDADHNAEEMAVDDAEEMAVVDDAKLDPVVEVDSCRKRSRSPSTMSSISYGMVPPLPSTCEKEKNGTASTVEQVQSTFNNMSVQHSPLRKFAKVNASSSGKSSTIAAVKPKSDDSELPTGKSTTDPGPSWAEKRTAELAQQSRSGAPKPARDD
jgi:hypothetical protein